MTNNTTMPKRGDGGVRHVRRPYCRGSGRVVQQDAAEQGHRVQCPFCQQFIRVYVKQGVRLLYAEHVDWSAPLVPVPKEQGALL